MKDNTKRKRIQEEEEEQCKQMRLIKKNEELLQLVSQSINQVLFHNNNAQEPLQWLTSQCEQILETLQSDIEGSHSLIHLITHSLDVIVSNSALDNLNEEQMLEEGILFCTRFLVSLIGIDPSMESRKQVIEALMALLSKIYLHESTKGSKRLGRQILQTLVEISADQEIFINAENLRLQKRLLSNWDPNVRSLCLKLTVLSSSKGTLQHDVRDLCCLHMHDRDARVRAEAVRCLRTWLSKSTNEDVEQSWHIVEIVYKQVVFALRDDYADVKMEAMDLLCDLANRYPRVRQNSLSIVEDAFVKLCTMVRDTVVSVRSMGCRLLGRLECSDLIGSNVLLETFNKMSLNYQSRSQQASKQVNQAALEQGTQQGDVASQVTDDEDDSRLYADAIGTFVLGLEDEFRQVRMACIDSIGRLSARSIDFALRAQQFLIESFNDEIDDVRISSIECLTCIARQGEVRLDHEQLQIVLILIEDRNRNIRFAIHELLSHVILSAGHQSLGGAVRALLVNELRKFEDSRQERDSVYRCLRNIGVNHPELCALLVQDLLQIRPHIMSAEQSLDDNDFYVGVLILVFGAATRNESIVSLLPDHIISKHLDQGKSRWPQFFPDDVLIVTIGKYYATCLPQITVPQRIDKQVVQDSEFQYSFDQVKRLVHCGEFAAARSMLSTLRAELCRMPPSPLTAYASLYFHMCQLYLRMLATGSSQKNIYNDLMTVINKIDVLYLQEDEQHLALGKQLNIVRVMVSVHQLLARKRSQLEVKSVQSMIDKLRSDNELLEDVWSIKAVASLFPSLILAPKRSLTVTPSFEIISPQSNGIDKSLSFPSYVPLVLHVESRIQQQVNRTDHIFILIQYPDRSHSLFPIGDNRQQDRTIIQTDVRIDMDSSWTEHAPLLLSLVISHDHGDLINDELDRRFVTVSQKAVQLYINPHR